MVRKAEADAKEQPWCCARADDDGLDEAKDVQCEAIDACVAQSVEHFVGNEEVTGSSPVAGSTWRCSSVGQSTRFIPVASLVQIQSPLPFGTLEKRLNSPASHAGIHGFESHTCHHHFP